MASDGRGRWAMCSFVAPGALALEAEGDVVEEPAPAPALTVAFAPVKGERTEWVVQKLTELGIDRIALVVAARSVVRWDPARQRSVLDRLGRVVREAGAQSRRVWLPELVGPSPLAEVVSSAGSASGLALAEPGGGELPATLAGIAIGPEGGWAPEEVALGRPLVRLADHVLRTETAAVAAAALLCARRTGTVGQ